MVKFPEGEKDPLSRLRLRTNVRAPEKAAAGTTLDAPTQEPPVEGEATASASITPPEKEKNAPAVEAPLPSSFLPPQRTEEIRQEILPEVLQRIDVAFAAKINPKELARGISGIVLELLQKRGEQISLNDQRSLVAQLLGDILERAHGLRLKRGSDGTPAVTSPLEGRSAASRDQVEIAKKQIQPLIISRIDIAAAVKLSRAELAQQLTVLANEMLGEMKIHLNMAEQRDLVTLMLNDMLGLGPLEPLLADETVNDIMVNGPQQVYAERRGKLELTEVKFTDNNHVMNICTRIVSRIGRRIDEANPLCDARLEDGSRVNIIIPPLALDGPSISIRKFSKKSITLDRMVQTQNISPEMATVLKIAARSRLNIIISGGTGSGKTTLLNALSQLIDVGERIVTIEDAAELQLQQPHVVRLETRPPNLEGEGEITMRDLVKNSLRMRPDRIILGEVRGEESFDMLQAMNTGHDGSLATLHANRPREALMRLENMVGMASANLAPKAIRMLIASAVHLIIQVSRMRDGVRRITHISEVIGMEGDVITTQDLFLYEFSGEGEDGKLKGIFRPTGLRPHFTPRAEYYGLHKPLLEAMGG
ncbi:MAG: ATPase, T2SS/T4P/T4SS family [Dongiaceae bacterium]